MIKAAFTSAPTASGEYLRIIALAYCNEGEFAFEMARISRAFAQSGYLRPQDRIIALAPKRVSLLSTKWLGELYLDSSCLNIESPDGSLSTLENAVSNPHGILLYKPLYGAREAPMRW